MWIRSGLAGALVAALLAAGCSARSAAPPVPPEGARPAVVDEERIDEELSVRRVAQDAYVITHEPFHASNVLVVQMPDGTLVICSSPFESKGTRAMLRWLSDRFRPPRMIAINTHFHLDGSGGNQAYAEAGVETYASQLTRELLAVRGMSHRDGAAAGFTEPALRARIEQTPIVPPEKTFAAEQGLTLTISGEEVRVIYPGAAHSSDNVVVHFPARKLLFGGCMIKTGSSIGYTGDADMSNWEAAVGILEPLAPEVVVPGHGDPGGAELLYHTARVVRSVRAGVGAAR
jgi:glyoxylase-like metal-dependent hydrolase (beta-lactamase superfamily II)